MALGASDRTCREGNLLQPIKSAIPIWEATCYQYRISALVPPISRHFAGKLVVASRNQKLSAVFVFLLDYRGRSKFKFSPRLV